MNTLINELFDKDELTTFAKALSSDMRVNILLWVAQNPGIGLKELADHFAVSRAAITQNIKILSAAGLIELGQSDEDSTARKGCFVPEDRFLLDFHRQILTQKIYTTEIPIGQYSNCSITPTCGIATEQELIGKVDQPRRLWRSTRTLHPILVGPELESVRAVKATKHQRTRHLYGWPHDFAAEHPFAAPRPQKRTALPPVRPGRRRKHWRLHAVWARVRQL